MEPAPYFHISLFLLVLIAHRCIGMISALLYCEFTEILNYYLEPAGDSTELQSLIIYQGASKYETNHSHYQAIQA